MSKEPVEKGLPCNLEAERLVLGSILLDDSFYVQASAALSSKDFSLEKHRKIFTRMTGLSAGGRRIDRVTLANELMRYGELESVDGLSYLVSLDDGLPRLPNLDSYVRIVKEKSDLRQVILTSQHMMNRALAGEETAKEILAGAREAILTLGDDESDGGPQTPEEIIQSLPGGISEFLEPRKMGLSTGLTKFDELTAGLHPGELTIIAARPSAGKTALAVNIAQYVALKLGKTVMVFSLEMSKVSLLDRMVCAEARVDSQRKRLGMLNSEERRKLADAIGRLAEAKLYIDDKSAASPADMHARIRRQMANGPVDLVIVDYLQLMSAGRNFENRNQEVTSISRGLKLLTAEIGAPVIALSQLSRAPENRKGNNRPQLSDLRESGAIEQDADNVHFIFREEMYVKDREDLRGVAELITAKQRQGPIGTTKLVFLHQLTKFENRAEDIDAPPDLLRSGDDDSSASYYS